MADSRAGITAARAMPAARSDQHGECEGSAGRLDVFDRRDPRPGERPRSSPATRCTSSRRSRICSMRWIWRRRRAGDPLKWKYEPKPEAGGAGRRLLRSGEPRLRLRGRADLLQHARCADRAASTPRPARKSGRPSSAIINKGESITMAPLVVKGKVTSATAAANSACAAGSSASTPTTATSLWTAYSTGPGQGLPDRPAVQAVLQDRTRARTWA